MPLQKSPLAFVILPLTCLSVVVSCSPLQAQEKRTDFNTPDTLTSWKVNGDANLDTTKNREGAGAALRIVPGSSAFWPLRTTDGAGRVEMWVYDDGTAPTDPKGRRNGPRWGLVQNDGRVLVVGAMYAPYLAGATTYAAADSDQKNWGQVQYTAMQRTPGWHQWVFDFDPVKGLSLTQDGKKARFDWNISKIKGFNGIALFGDETVGQAQTIWVDDVAATLGGPMQAVPVPPPPPPPAEPATDPRPETPVDLVPALKNQHPRLLFSAAQIPAMKALAAGEGKAYFDQLKNYLPSAIPPQDTKFASDDTEAQRQGFWRLPTVALHYVLTGDPTSRERTRGYLEKLVATAHWQTGAEQDSGMGAGNMLAGAALAYDWTYNDLDPQFREKVRQKLLLQARRLYYRGHLKRGGGVTYWQGDPQNNHRWHRNAGLSLAVLAVAGDGPEDDWILAETRKELQFISDWLPEDGTSHESSSYMTFGAPYLVLAFQASDRCLGTKFLEQDFFKDLAAYRLHTLTPGLKNVFHYGDSDGFGFISNYLFKTTSVHRQPDEQAALLVFAKANPTAFSYGWFSLLWFDPTLTSGSLQKLPQSQFFPDLGMGIVRDGWSANNVGAMFKSAPYGGLKLNEYRNANNMAYINVAHDDPDANMFLLYGDGALLADDDRYSTNKSTSSHNTILVNGKGQKGDKQHWTQPLKGRDADMTKMAYITAQREKDDVFLIEGEAGGAYADLQRYRRTMLWVKGRYIVLLDDIRATKPSEITWLVQGADVKITDPITNRFRLQNGTAFCDFQVASDTKWDSQVEVSTAEHRGKSLNYQQLQLTTDAAQTRVATVFDPWHQKNLTLRFEPNGTSAKVTIQGEGFSDEWTWQTAPDEKAASTLQLKRDWKVAF